MHTLKPRLSEKAFGLSQTTNTFVIDVPSELNRYEIANAVEKQFDVKVKTVRVVNRKGKVKRIMNTTGKRSSNRKGVQADYKKAYVTLVADSHLPFFAAAEEEIAVKAKAAEKAKKASEAKADAKPKGLKKLVAKKEAK
ncbi:50S ribosomal protein L23 [Candidatus Saccharibacteria bacterium]|nr:MAG: 50S ribosomal protein L23 [Candidatus Saccharibacteria bacterium]